MKKILASLAITFLVINSMAQTKITNVSGVVVNNSKNKPVVSAVITFQQSSKQVVTDNNGKFSINITLPDTINITHVGYETTHIALNDTTIFPLNISLNAKTKELEAVVISTGYQSLPKERVTGSFEQVSNKMLQQQAGTNILARLEGVSSLQFDKNAIRPQITLRGLSSIYAATAPLIIVDNFPYEGSMENINPNDVENITILKDAAAASIWGARAGNGVIVITTKKGKYNQPFSLEVNTNVTIAGKPDLYYLQKISSTDFIDVEQFLFDKGYFKNKETARNRPALSPVVELFIKQRDGLLSADKATEQINALRSNDIRDDLLQYSYQPFINQQYAINMKGGSDKINYYLSGGLDKNSDNLAATLQRITLRSENIFRPLKNNKLQLSAGIVYTNTSTMSGKPGITTFNNLPPYTSLADANGNALAITKDIRQSFIDTAGNGKLLDWKYYPLEDYKHDRRNTQTSDLLLNLGLQYKFTKQLSFDIKYQYEKQQFLNERLSAAESYAARSLINTFTQIDHNTGALKYIVPVGGILDQTSTDLQSQGLRGQLNYNHHQGKHRINAIAGMEIRAAQTISNANRLYGYNEDLLTYSNVDQVNAYPSFISGLKIYIPSSIYLSQKDNRFVSTYANAAYTFDNRYTISASARRDASNMFGVHTNDKWTPLWSAGASWNISREPFYTSKTLPQLKLRLSYGVSGNVDPNRSAVATIKYAQYPAIHTNFSYATTGQFANPNLRWEKIKMLNAAIDFGFINNTLSGSIEYYIKKGEDLLSNVPVDYTAVPTRSLVANAAHMKGSGIDFNLHTKNIDKQFAWNTTFIFSYNNNKVTSYKATSNMGANYLSGGNGITPFEGKPIYSILAYKSPGLDKEGNPQGIIDGKLSTDYTAIRNATTISDLVYSGSATPTIFGSVINSFGYKNLSLNIGLNYKLGYYFIKESINYDNLFRIGLGHSDFTKRWQQSGDEAHTSIPAMGYPANYLRDGFYNQSEQLIRKGDHLRLQYVQLSYTIQPTEKKGMLFKQLQVYLNAANVGILWRANKDGVDPELTYNTSSVMPAPRNFTIGIRGSF